MDEHPVAATHPQRREQDPFPWNVVVMGMGEPLLNYDATVAALRVLMDPEGFGVPPRKLTLSTVGILPALEKLAQEPVRPNLAISLHAPDPGLRRALMPIEAKYPMSAVIDAALRYPVPRGGRGDLRVRAARRRQRHARPRARAGAPSRRAPCQGQPDPAQPRARDPVPGPAARGRRRLRGRPRRRPSVTVSVRRSRGRDILAACGQLHVTKAGRARRPAALSLAALSRSALRARRWRCCSRRSLAPAAAAPVGAAAGAGRGLLHGRRARHGRERRLARAALRGTAVLRQAGPDLLADGRLRCSALGPTYAAARLVPVLAALALVARDRLAGRAAVRPPLGARGRARAGDDARLPLLRARRDVGHAARAVDHASPWRSRCGPAAARPPAWVVPALGAVARPRLRHQGADRAAGAGRRAPAAAAGERARPATRRSALAGLTARRRSRSRSSASAGSRSSTPAWAAGAARPLLPAREPGALRRARPTTSAGRSGSTRPRTSPRACPGRASCRSPCGACCAAARPIARAPDFLAGWAALVVVPLSLSRGKIDYYLLPVYPRAVAGGRPLPGWRALARARPRLCAGRARARRGGDGPAAGPAARASRPGGCPTRPRPAAGRWSRRSPRSSLLAAALRPTPARVLAALATATAAGFLLLVTLFLPAFSVRSAQPRDRRRTSRASALYVPPRAAGRSARTRPACGGTCCSPRGTRASSSATCGASRPRASPTCSSSRRAQAASFRVAPEATATSRSYSYLPARALTLGGLLDGVERRRGPARAPNYATPDPVAERKRTQGVPPTDPGGAARASPAGRRALSERQAAPRRGPTPPP